MRKFLLGIAVFFSFTASGNASFLQYVQTFREPFAKVIAKFSLQDHWIDGGCGRGYALTEFISVTDPKQLKFQFLWEAFKDILEPVFRLEPTQRGFVTGIDLENYEEFEKWKNHPQVNFLGGKGLEELPLDTVKPGNLITDRYGAASFSPQLEEVINRYLHWLELDGLLFIQLRVMRQVKSDSGQLMDLDKWLQAKADLSFAYLSTGFGNVFYVKRILALSEAGDDPIIARSNVLGLVN